MYILLLGLSIFFAVHLVPGSVGLRHKIITYLGESTYKRLYAIIALIGLILIIYGKSIAEYQPIWAPPVWSKNVVIVVMVISFFFLTAADMKSNIKRYIRHPMLIGVALWSAAHLFANGDLASMLLFGSFSAYSLFAMISANIRGTTIQEKRYPYTKDAVAVIAGLVAYVVFIKFIHPYLIGVTI